MSKKIKDGLEKRVAKSIKNNANAKKAYFESILILVSALLIFITSSIFLYNAHFKYTPPASFIVLNEDSRILEELPLTEDIMSYEELSNHVNKWFYDIFTYHYLNIDEHGEKIKPYFASDAAYSDFINVFSELRLQSRVRQLRAIVQPIVVEPMVVKSSSIYNNFRRIYQMEGVYVLEIITPQGKEVLRYRINMIISRRNLIENPYGYAIEVIALR